MKTPDARYTRRWFRFPDSVVYHPAQSAWQTSAARFNVVAAGRRSYKTERAKRRLVCAALIKRGNYFFAAPTHKQAKRISWTDLKDLTRPFHADKASESELTIHLANGSRISVIGMDVPSRIEGVQWMGGVLDEYADMKPEVWGRHVQPVFADTNGWCDVIGVPEGRNHYFELAQYARTSGDSNWAFFTWKSADVLPPDAIETARRQLDEKSFRQEYEASFEQAGGIVYYAFSAANVVTIEFDPYADTILAWDFNAGSKPMTCLVLQQSDTQWIVVKEFSEQYTNTETMCALVREYLFFKKFCGSLSVCGDYAGHSRRSSASSSDYAIIESVFRQWRNYTVRTRPTRRIRDRVNALNALFCNAAGQHRLRVNPQCAVLIKDLQTVLWRANGLELDDSNELRTHSSDALSYFAYNYYPLEIEPHSL